MQHEIDFHRFDYAVGLFSVLFGLALGDMAISTHRLLKRAHEVKWSVLAVVTAAYVALTIVSMWYDVWAVQTVQGVTSFWFYVSLLFELFLLFLLAAAVLPDEADGPDLRAYFDRQQRYIWTLLLLFYVSYSGHWIYFRLVRRGHLGSGWEVAEQAWPLLAFLGLLVLRKPRVQLLLVIALFFDRGLAYALQQI